MALTYATYVTTLANMLAMDSADADFTTVLPSIIDYAEDRIYREHNFLSTVARDSSSTLTANSRNFTLPTASGRFTSVDAINVMVSSVRVPLTPVSRDVLDMLFPSETSVASTPSMFAMVTDATILVGSAPSSGLTVEVVGRRRPTALSASNTTTTLSTYLPDLFLAASMVFASGWQKNFGGQADDPKMSQSWESQYQTLSKSASMDELRKTIKAA